MLNFIIGMFIGVMAGILVIAIVSGGVRADLETEIYELKKKLEDK